MIIFEKTSFYLKRIRERIYRNYIRKKNYNKSFTIISNNCWGGSVYEDLDLAYTTPTVGLFFYGPCYIKFLSNLKYYLSQDIVFVDKSSYQIANEDRSNSGLFYPIGKLDDIEIHFLHYHSELDASEKWNRRKDRINFDNLFVAFAQNELVDYELMNSFDNLDYNNKVIFSSQNFENLNSLVWIKDRQGFDNVGDIYTNKNIWRKEFDVVKWLNDGRSK